MTYDELRNKIKRGAFIKCDSAKQKQAVICMLYDMGFDPGNTRMRDAMYDIRRVDMGFPYVGLGMGFDRIDGYTAKHIDVCGDPIIPADEALSVEVATYDLGDITSLLV